jgi:glycosyltransferase involved in cell wall biosynthesis
MIGQLYSAKGWPDFIDVIGHLFEDGFNIRAMIVGEGELRHELEQRVLNRGLQKHIEFTGFQSNIPEILHRLDIFLLTSHTEGLPVVIIEAMASGLPVVATDIAGIGEQVEDGENGFLVQVGDTEKIAALCARLIRNPEMRSFMGKTSRAIAEKKFSEDRMLHEYVACYKGAKSLHNTKKRPQSKLGKSYPQ